ncbi:MAG: hypothetical protein AAF213_06685 [Pseudomonadota bacterium]
MSPEPTRHFRLSTTLCTGAVLAGLVVIAASTMMTVGQRVEHLRGEKAALSHEIERQERALHMLQAEWAHLTRPERLRDLAMSMTDLRPTDAIQLTSMTGLTDQLETIKLTPTAPHCAGLPPPPRKPTVDSNGILLATYGLGGDPI